MKSFTFKPAVCTFLLISMPAMANTSRVTFKAARALSKLGNNRSIASFPNYSFGQFEQENINNKSLNRKFRSFRQDGFAAGLGMGLFLTGLASSSSQDEVTPATTPVLDVNDRTIEDNLYGIEPAAQRIDTMTDSMLSGIAPSEFNYQVLMDQYIRAKEAEKANKIVLKPEATVNLYSKFFDKVVDTKNYLVDKKDSLRDFDYKGNCEQAKKQVQNAWGKLVAKVKSHF